MIDEGYVFDTYALVEIIGGNPKYQKYMDARVVITEFILAELCIALMRKTDLRTSFEQVDKFAGFVVSVNKEVIKEAMLYRFKNMRRQMSATDCIGYFLAKSLDIKFLTGDEEFKAMPGVEFVK